VCPNGGLYNFVADEHCRIKPMSFKCALCNCDSRSRAHKAWRYSRHMVQKKLGGVPSDIKNFISVSDYSERLLKPHLPPESRFYRVRNPIDISRRMPANVSQNRVFTFVGRLSPEKGATLFASAAKKANVEAAFVGRGSEDLKILKAHPEASLLGWHDRDGVANHIIASRAVVFPSLLHETQGMVVLEAAALGVPAIVSDNCAARDSVIDGKTGLLFRAGDISDLSEKIRYLDSNPIIASQMGKSAYDRYWSNPSTLENHIEDLIKCYKGILGENNVGSEGSL